MKRSTPEWNSDDDYILEINYSSEYDNDCTLKRSDFYVLGFHPYKEVIFLAESHIVVCTAARLSI